MINILYYWYWLFRTWNVRRKFPSYKILSIEETIDIVTKEKKSISRLGDADFLLLIEERDVSYQKLSPLIAQKLNEVLQCRDSRFLICIPDTLVSQKGSIQWSKVHWKSFIYKYGSRLKNHLDVKYLYGNSNLSRIYIEKQDVKRAVALFDKVKSIWNEKHVIIVEGEYTRFGVGNDLLSNALSVKRIIGPKKNAFESFDKIKNSLLQFPKEEVLFLFSLGPTATILCHELALEGYWAVDIGNLDLEYMWMKAGAKQKISIKGRFSVETSNSDNNLVLDEEDGKVYRESIILDLSNEIK